MLFFGSARAKDREGWEAAVAKAEAEVVAATDDESRKVIITNMGAIPRSGCRTFFAELLT